MSDLIIAGLSPATFMFSLVVVFLAAIVRGYSGFGFSALMVTSLSLVIEPIEVVPMALILEIFASAHLLPKVWKDIDRRLVGWMFLGSAVALPFGVKLLASLPAMGMRTALYMICLAAVVAIWRNFTVRDGHGIRHMLTAGLVSGLVNGATSMGGLMVAIFLLTGTISAAAMRASMIAFFLAMDIYTTAFTGAEGLLSDDVLWRTAVFIPPLLLGNMLGHRKFVTTAPASFRRYTLILLMVLSGFGLARTLLGS